MFDNFLRWISFQMNKPRFPVYKQPGGYMAWKDRKPPKQPTWGPVFGCAGMLIFACMLATGGATGAAYYFGRSSAIDGIEVTVELTEEITPELTIEATLELTEESTEEPRSTDTATPTVTATVFIPTEIVEENTVTPSATITDTATVTVTALPTLTAIPTATIKKVYANSQSQQQQPPQVIYITSIPPKPEIVVVTATPSNTPKPTRTLTATATVELTEEITPELTEEPTLTSTATATIPIVEVTEAPTATNTATATLTPELTPEVQMSLINDLIDYFTPKPKFKSVPRQIISDYKIMEADEQEQLLMLLNKARSPQSARNLMEKYQAQHAADVLRQLPKRKKITFWTRLKRLLLKMDGHDERDPYRCDLRNMNKLD